jgi:hypothetical protein
VFDLNLIENSAGGRPGRLGAGGLVHGAVRAQGRASQGADRDDQRRWGGLPAQRPVHPRVRPRRRGGRPAPGDQGRAQAPGHVPRLRVDQPRRRRHRGGGPRGARQPPGGRRVRHQEWRGVRRGREVDGDQGRVPAQEELLRRRGYILKIPRDLEITPAKVLEGIWWSAQTISRPCN